MKKGAHTLDKRKKESCFSKNKELNIWKSLGKEQMIFLSSCKKHIILEGPIVVEYCEYCGFIIYNMINVQWIVSQSA